jgi:hypothetical protein
MVISMEKRILRLEDEFWRIRTDTGELTDAERDALRAYLDEKGFKTAMIDDNLAIAEPRIEPEIIFKLALALAPGMAETALLGLHRLGRARFRKRAVNLSWMEVFSTRRGRGVRLARCPANWASSFNRSACRGLEPDASTFEIDLKREGTVVDHGRHSRARSG